VIAPTKLGAAAWLFWREFAETQEVSPRTKKAASLRVTAVIDPSSARHVSKELRRTQIIAYGRLAPLAGARKLTMWVPQAQSVRTMPSEPVAGCLDDDRITIRSVRIRDFLISPVAFAAVGLTCWLCHGTAAAQDAPTPFDAPSRPTIGRSMPSATTPTFSPRGQTDILRHRDFAGKPCLTLSGTARPHLIDRKLYDHVIIASNACPQRIGVRVCYFRTDNCISMEVPGRQRKEAILGTLPSTQEFGFEFREKF
jgi:hypothetical protein